MPQTTIIKILLSCPFDVQQDLYPVVKTAIEHWNRCHEEYRSVSLRLINWADDSVPEYGDRPQAILNRQLVDPCDCIIAIFGTRFGTPTGKADSGTLEEILECHKAGKYVAVFFSRMPADISNIDSEQLAKLKKFKASFTGIYVEFSDIAKFRDSLDLTLNRYVDRALSTPNKSQNPTVQKIELSNKAKLILSNMAVDKNGRLSKIRSRGGLHVIINDYNYCSPNDVRDEAECEFALKQLCDNEYIARVGEHSYQITKEGFNWVDKFRSTL